MDLPALRSVSGFVILPGPVGGIDRAGLGVPVFSRTLYLRNLGLFVFRVMHVLVIFRAVIFGIIRIRPSHTCFCHDVTSCIAF